VKNAAPRSVRKRTIGADRPETPDRRVQRTKSSLHEALIGLAREKPYPSIAVKEILDRANVGKSTFYTHFRDKDELLESGIHEMLQSIQRRSGQGSSLEQVVAFSLPILRHVDEHRHVSGQQMTREGRLVMHEHLRDVLTNLIADDLVRLTRIRRTTQPVPIELIARHVATAFVLVLNWWVESNERLTPGEVDAHFRSLVLPALRELAGQAG
jgi:AcrR family transcriptional regulator